MQRNGVMMQIAEGAGQKQSWSQVEASVGGTSLETPQGLSVWLSDLSTRHGLASLTPTEPLASPEPEPEQEKAGSAAGAFKLTPLPPPAPASELRPQSAPQPSDPKAVDMAERMRAKLAGEAERSAAPTRSTYSRPSTKTSGSKKKKSSGADAYDPMNGTL